MIVGQRPGPGGDSEGYLGSPLGQPEPRDVFAGLDELERKARLYADQAEAATRDLAAMRAQNEAFRTALDRIAKMHVPHGPTRSDNVISHGYVAYGTLAQAAEIARGVLGGEDA